MERCNHRNSDPVASHVGAKAPGVRSQSIVTDPEHLPPWRSEQNVVWGLLPKTRSHAAGPSMRLAWLHIRDEHSGPTCLSTAWPERMPDLEKLNERERSDIIHPVQVNLTLFGPTTEDPISTDDNEGQDREDLNHLDRLNGFTLKQRPVALEHRLSGGRTAPPASCPPRPSGPAPHRASAAAVSTTGLEVRRTEPRRATVHFASDVVEERGRAVAGPPRGEGGVGQGGCRAESAVSKDGSRGAASGGQGLYSSANGQSSRKRQGAPGSDVARGRTSSYSAPRRPRQEEARRDWRAFTSAGNVPLVKSKQGKGARKGRTHGSEDWDKRRHAGIAEVPSWRRRSAGHVVEGVPGWRRFSGLGSQNSGMIDPVGAMALQGVGGLAVRSPAPGGTAGGG